MLLSSFQSCIALILTFLCTCIQMFLAASFPFNCQESLKVDRYRQLHWLHCFLLHTFPCLFFLYIYIHNHELATKKDAQVTNALSYTGHSYSLAQKQQLSGFYMTGSTRVQHFTTHHVKKIMGWTCMHVCTPQHILYIHISSAPLSLDLANNLFMAMKPCLHTIHADMLTQNTLGSHNSTHRLHTDRHSSPKPKFTPYVTFKCKNNNRIAMCHDNICLNLVGGKLFQLPFLVGWMGFCCM